MLHRHLNHEQFSLAAIDDIISRGKKKDWADLRLAVIADSNVREKVIRVCRAYAHDPYAQRYHFWVQYADRLGQVLNPPSLWPMKTGVGLFDAHNSAPGQSPLN